MKVIKLLMLYSDALKTILVNSGEEVFYNEFMYKNPSIYSSHMLRTSTV
jgi:hypothetical protein